MLPPIEARATGTSFTVVVGNVSPGATEANLREFFSFAGSVTAVELSSDVPGALQQGSVTFSTAQGAETAILLDGALIADRPITIRAPPDDPLQSTPVPPPPAAAVPAPKRAVGAVPTAGPVDVSDHPAPPEVGWASDPLPPPGGRARSHDDDGPSASDAIAALLSHGYTLGQRAISFLHDFEEQNGHPAATAVAMIKEGAEAVRARVKEVDEEHAITASVRAPPTPAQTPR